MRRKSRFAIILLSSALLFGCTNNTTSLNNSGNSDETTDPNRTKAQTEKPVEKTNQNEQSLLDYFLPAGSKAQFHGEGNEYAGMDIDFAHPYEDYVILNENNGGTLIRRIYKIEEDQITKMEEKTVDLNADFPSLKEIEEMEPIGVYLKKPLKVGTTFDGWKIVETNVTVETPYETFGDAFVIEEKGDDYINRKYFVKGYGEVKRESIMQTVNEDADFIVTSSLKSVSKPK
ncbi:hypothetical protein [Sporosarcina sp. SAFN-015]|uniref:hypothetical protein n=1 Tax=Sporosarcina sp. SAFN-015 TaxID=3387274 RepID=UPI003F7FA780